MIRTALAHLFLFAFFLLPQPVSAQPHNVPLTEMTVPYLGLGQPGLYPGGANVPTGPHWLAGQAALAQLEPLDAAGTNLGSPRSLVVLSIGISNTNQKWSRFERDADAARSHGAQVVLLDGAVGGWDASLIASPAAAYWNIVSGRIAAAGLTPAQVQVVWLMQSLPGESFVEAFPHGADVFRGYLTSILGILRTNYPNLRVVYFTSRAYAGNASGHEPWVYETGFAIQQLIADQQNGDVPASPWIAWGPYFWSDGATPRSDGFFWLPADVEADHVHPSPSGEQKAANLLRAFFWNAPAAGSFFHADSGFELAKRDAVADAHTDSGQPTTPLGNAVRLEASSTEVTYLRFSLAGLSALPSSAKLSLLVDADLGVPTLQLHSVAGSWQEASITAQNAPAIDPAVLRQMPSASRGSAITFDATTEVQQALAASANEISFALTTNAASPGVLISREGGEPPRLLLTLPSQPLFADGFESGDVSAWL